MEFLFLSVLVIPALYNTRNMPLPYNQQKSLANDFMFDSTLNFDGRIHKYVSVAFSFVSRKHKHANEWASMGNVYNLISFSLFVCLCTSNHAKYYLPQIVFVNPLIER